MVAIVVSCRGSCGWTYCGLTVDSWRERLREEGMEEGTGMDGSEEGAIGQLDILRTCILLSRLSVCVSVSP